MIDQTSISIVDVVTRYGAQIKRTGGHWWAGQCPFCGGKDRFYINEQQNAWGCRHCSAGYNDALTFIAKRTGLDLKHPADLKEAKKLLSLPDERPQRPRSQQPTPSTPSISALKPTPSDGRTWQQHALKFINDSYSQLRKDENSKAWDYLTGKRGLHPAVLAHAGVGFNPVDVNARWGDVDVYAPRGVVLGWEHCSTGHINRIRIRTANPDKKYAQIAGGSNALYMPFHIKGDSVVVLCEGELDALAVRTACYQYAAATWDNSIYRAIVPVATGGTTQGRVLRNAALLSIAKRVLVAFDDDSNGAGEDASRYWLSVLPNAVRRAPTKHDLNDMLVSGENILEWALA